MSVAGAIPFNGAPRLPLIGTVLTLAGVALAELLAEPFDVVWIDLEHGALGRAEAQDMILGAQAAHAHALVRVGAAGAEALIGPMLDAGADGIVAADVRSREQAARIVALMQYPPDGRRGYGPRRSVLRGRLRGEERREARLWAQIESQEGVAAAEEIARTPGVNALVAGIADLCTDLRIPIGRSDPRLHDALRAVSAAADLTGKRFGLAGPLQPARELADLLDAAYVLVHSTDARLCAGAVDSLAASLRDQARAASAGEARPTEVGSGG
jgi:4-hydroxy-2-oxoheptanedioate aldolase